MDEATTKEELRPVKKQLVSAIPVGFGIVRSYAFLEKPEALWGGYATR
jgi:hypothetical protein